MIEFEIVCCWVDDSSFCFPTTLSKFYFFNCDLKMWNVKKWKWVAISLSTNEQNSRCTLTILGFMVLAKLMAKKEKLFCRRNEKKKLQWQASLKGLRWAVVFVPCFFSQEFECIFKLIVKMRWYKNACSLLLCLEWNEIFYRRENGLSLLFFQIVHTVYLTRKEKEKRIRDRRCAFGNGVLRVWT